MSKNTKKVKYTQAEVYRIRYSIYRDLGYSSAEARKLRSRKLDVSEIKLNKQGKPRKYSKKYKETINNLNYDKYVKDMSKVKNDTVHSRWGMYTQDKRYRDKTARQVDKLKKRLNITTDQAYFFLYMMSMYNMSFDETKRELMSNREFEIYANQKRTANYRKNIKKGNFYEK